MAASILDLLHVPHELTPEFLLTFSRSSAEEAGPGQRNPALGHAARNDRFCHR